MGHGVAMVTAWGGIAQLGERLLCKQEVSGSIPLASTTIFDCDQYAPAFAL